ncbi:MAG: MBL fold metallo-hydrolase [Thiotrichales bacterium]|jgi:glyoxylase-like metal-dependent hydrolase (beta-lactamase superfamily II)|nr:MBL fold metallo-hydrolase [Thiotrichales bacterium]MBT3613123.1 MBL fold metallo-hydrolase [Thiotrichales bacterium]MBT3752166.1 MBL fold metallo-hydrolase [Thiotrichales bacterium]MBT4152219.1 MBL fold metallo-hydrolase [Thiotrichales bacterium]MBT4261206.1 MBL fold metallo-hydrolase [Thiotrichales bacterium]
MAKIHRLELGGMENLIHLVEDEESNTLAVIDPAWEVGKITAFAEERGLKIVAILQTHGHFDHVDGTEELAAVTGAKVYISAIEASFFELDNKGWEMFSAPFSYKLGSSEIIGVATPGHTPGGVCYFVDGNLITGDTLFVNGCGRCDLPGGDSATLYRSLRSLVEKFPPETKVYPGHHYALEYSSTLEQELVSNPYLRCESEDEFVNYRM